MTQGRPRPIVLLVLDGFGIGSRPEADAIATARMPAWRALLEAWPHSRLEASGEAVGLPAGQMGNSEVGHLNLGAGRPVLQDLPRIDAAIADGSFAANEVLQAACRRAAEPGRRLHLVSLIGPGGVHAMDRHLVAMAELACRSGVRDVVVHAILDGRDTPPRSAAGFMRDLAGAPRERPARRRGSRPWRVATSPWTATTAGTAPREATSRSSVARACRRPTRWRPSRPPTAAARTTNSSSRR